MQRLEQRLEGPGRQWTRRVLVLVRLERGESLRLVHTLGFVGKEHGVTIERDPHFVRMRIFIPRLRVDERRRKADVERRLDVGDIGGKKKIGLQWMQIRERRAAAREYAALDAERRTAHRTEHTQSRHRIVARQDDDLDPLVAVGVEFEELLHQPERDTRFRRLLEPIELHLHVSLVVRRLEDRVLFLEVEERAR